MQSFSPTTPLRSSALLYVIARAGVNAQLPSSSVCNGAFTVTYVPEPVTVTVYARNFSSSGSIDPSGSLSSRSVGSPSLTISGLSGSSSLVSTSSQITVPSSVLPTGILSYDSLSLSTTSPSRDLSKSSVSSILTVPSTTAPTLVVPSFSTSNFVGGSTSLPTLSVSSSSKSLGLPSSGVSVSLSGLLSTGSPSSSGLPTSIQPPSPLPSSSLPLTTLQPSSLSNVPSSSVTSPAVSLTSGQTISITSSATPSLGSLTLSPTLPTLSPTGSLSGLSLSSATSTGLITSLSSVTALQSLSGTSLSLSTLSIPSTRTNGALPTPSVLTSVYCAGDDGLQYLSPDDRSFQLACNKRRLGSILQEYLASNLQSCTDYCGVRTDCQSVSYNPANGNCLLNSDTGSEVLDNDWQSALATDLSCPGADNTQYMDNAGSFYQVLCDYSFPQSYNITTSPGRDYLDCSSKCSNLSTCSGFSYTDGVCTFTNGLGMLSAGMTRNGTNTVVLVAKRAVRVGPDSVPVVSAVTIATNPRTSMSALLQSTTSFLSGVSGMTATFLPPIIPSTGLPSSTIGVPSSLGLTSPGSIGKSITNILPTTSSLPPISNPSISISSLSSLLPTIPTVTAPSLNSSSLRSATIPTSQGPTQTYVSYTCPEVDGRVIVENGLSYVLNCSSIADSTPYASFPASSGFNDCFKTCDQSSTEGGAKYCTAFTYEGADRGAGPGTCYLFNDVSKSFLPANGRKAITAIRTANYAPGVVVDGVSSVLSSLLPGVTLSSTIPATTIVSSLSASLPSAGIVTLPTSGRIPVTTCSNGRNILNGCVDATATIGAGAGASGGVVLGPSGSPIVSAGVSAMLGVSLSADAGLGLGLSAGSSGLSLGLSVTLGVDLGATAGEGLGLGLGGKPTTSTPAPAIASTTSRSTSPATTPPLSSRSTTTVFTTSTIISCLTGVGGVLTCPIGGLFTTLPSTSGAITSISTSTSTQTSISVSISISYITVTAATTSSTAAVPASTLSTVTISSSRSSSSSASSTSTSTSTCKGTVNILGVCILPAVSGI